MKKRQILMLTLAGMLSFVSVFAVSWFFTRNSTEALPSAEPSQAAATNTANEPGSDQFAYLASVAQQQPMGMTERQLQSLMQDIRNKSRDYQKREQALDTKAERIEITSQSMQDDINRLNELRNKLSQILSDIEQKQERLQESIVEIEGIEQENFKRLASTYEKMDVTQACRIMVNMAVSNQLQDSVKILYYMNERTAGKLLGEIATAKPELASVICMQLKHVKEGT